MPSYNYPDELQNIDRQINLWAQLKTETGAPGVADKVAEISGLIAEKLAELRALPDDAALQQEPDDLAGIRALRPAGARRQWKTLPEATYRDRITGAINGRFAGCILGSIVECWEIDKMERWAAYNGEAFPPVDYWKEAERPNELKYRTRLRDTFTRSRMDGVPTDDDIIYTQLGLLILEDYGPDFTVADVGAAWMKYLPHAATAEGVALRNLHAGVPPMDAAIVDNPFMFWIGADIRSDPWGYAAPGYPEKAAEFAWRDATISHRRNGIYGAMYFSTAIAAAFATGDPVEALELGLAEIPADSLLAREVRWALDAAGDIKDYRGARAAVDERFSGMHRIHTINNAALTIWGLTIGGDDFTKVISETVAMGLDNDCTAATAGSIFGAAYGIDAIPEHWTRNFNNKVYSYIIGHPEFALDDMIARYTALARQVHAGD
ncbi:MAG: ADP-ribosylglycohydrolase family protein [Chloroflexota bacterium]|nr:ADP-ribosylglycohydrolase family protein [Chloroflexota bacterium]MDE2910837.1 ADP-ribosylglycohydrolase family protein [Chloroflexota bacterium]